MAKVYSCKYCGASLVDAEYHPECRVIELEDVLARIKRALKKHKGGRLPMKLQGEIAALNVHAKAKPQKLDRLSFDHIKSIIGLQPPQSPFSV